MKVTFLGQQGWLISNEVTNILVDPILTETFGTSKELQFRVYPPRTIDICEMPKISAIFITNEHLDHFHLSSLRLIDKSIPIYVGKVMPNCVKFTIKQQGFKLFELNNAEMVEIGPLKARFYIGSSSVPIWEKRVYQLYITDQNDYGIFIQSDTLISDFFLSQVKKQIEPCPRIFIATNNAQILSQDKFGAFSNLLANDGSDLSSSIGIETFEEVLIKYPEQLPEISHILMSGGGYIMDNLESKPFLFTEIEKVNNYMKELSLGLEAKMLYPGQSLIYKGGIVNYGSESWVRLDEELYKSYLGRSSLDDATQELELRNPIFNINDIQDIINQKDSEIQAELALLSQLILLSQFGRNLLSVNEYLDGPLGARRFVINLRIDDKKAILYALNVNSARFELVEQSFHLNELMRLYPFGVELYFSDFIALLEGRIQIWELATANIRQWYLGDKTDSPVAFLYSYFSEQVRPDLAYKVYETICG